MCKGAYSMASSYAGGRHARDRAEKGRNARPSHKEAKLHTPSIAHAEEREEQEPVDGIAVSARSAFHMRLAMET